MNVTGLLFLIVSQYISGRGFLRFFKLELKAVPGFCLANLIGVMLFSFIPFVLQLFYISISFQNVLISICLLTLLMGINQIIGMRHNGFKLIKPKWPFRLYELPFVAVLIILCLASIWNCFYLPINARDILSGPEVIAEYTVREHTMINSVFSVNLETTNNHLKPPFITCLQIIYKIFVQPFGQVWLSILVVNFLIWMYHLLKEKLHPVIVGILLLLFVSMPEVFGHTSLILFDYSNMIFFFCGFYFLTRWLKDGRLNELAFSAVLFGFSTYIRTDTLLFILMLAPAILYSLYKNRISIGKGAIMLIAFMAIPGFFYFIWMSIYIGHYMPVHFDVSQQLNHHLSDISVIFDRLSGINKQLIFGNHGVRLFGYFNLTFCGILLIDLIFFRKFSQEGFAALYGIGMLYIGLSILGYLIPWADLLNTTKREFFKLFPIMLLYFRNSAVLLKITSLLNNWEFPPLISAGVKPIKVKAVNNTQQQGANKPSNPSKGGGRKGGTNRK